MTTQLVAICPKCGCDAMAETRTLKPSELPALDEIPDLPSPANTKRVFTCSNCGTKFKRSPGSEAQSLSDSYSTTQHPRAVCPKCGYSGEMWESSQEETPIKSKWYGVRHLPTSRDITWVHICLRCGKRFEQLA